MSTPVRVLFVCTGNAARSQMAEALLGHLGAGRFVAASAGSHPANRVSPLAVETLREHGIAWEERHPKPISDVEEEPWDVVITVCDHAREHCPVFYGARVVAHWGMPDPATVADETARRAAFRDTFAILRRRLERFVALPFDETDDPTLAAAIERVGDS
jgi:arsenate reductase